MVFLVCCEIETEEMSGEGSAATSRRERRKDASTDLDVQHLEESSLNLLPEVLDRNSRESFPRRLT